MVIRTQAGLCTGRLQRGSKLDVTRINIALHQRVQENYGTKLTHVKQIQYKFMCAVSACLEHFEAESISLKVAKYHSRAVTRLYLYYYFSADAM